MAVMEYCRPMGMPIMHRVRQERPSSCRSSLLVRRMVYFLRMYTRQAKPDTV